MPKNIVLSSDSSGYGPLGAYLLELDETFDVVLDYYLFTVPENSKTAAELHTQLAELGMKFRSIRNEEYFDSLRKNVIAKPDKYHFIDPDRLGPAARFSINQDISKATSWPVTIEQFRSQYEAAFLDPPYGLRCSKEDAKNKCEESLLRILGDLDKYAIRQWSDNWSNYFDAGKEWWGTYLWTLISNSGNGVWIAASTTD